MDYHRLSEQQQEQEPLEVTESSGLLNNSNGIHTTDPSPSVNSSIINGGPQPYTGSRARDHLANERTYLAWVRTGLALLGASIGLLKWEDISNVAAYLVALLGLSVLLISTRRYFRVMVLLDRGQFEPNVFEAFFVVTFAMVIISVTFLIHEIKARQIWNAEN